MEEPHEIPGMMRIPKKGMPKKRPVVTRNNTYMPPDYVAWKREVGEELKAMGVASDQHIGNVALEVILGSDAMWVQVIPVSDTKPKGMRTSDVDNVVGALMDALQDYGVFKDDKQVVQLDVSYRQEDE